MSTILNTNGAELEIPQVADAENFKCAIFTAEWNPKVTYALRDGAIDVLRKAGYQIRACLCRMCPALWNSSTRQGWP